MQDVLSVTIKEARVGIEPTNTAFAEPRLTTWLPRQKRTPELRIVKRRGGYDKNRCDGVQVARFLDALPRIYFSQVRDYSRPYGRFIPPKDTP